MFRSSYMHEIDEKDDRSDVLKELGSGESLCSGSMGPGLERLNSRFASYIHRARVLEQRNAVFRVQLETLQHMEEATGLEKILSEQISTNQQRVRELQAERTNLERELRDAEGMLQQFSDRYRNKCEYQDQLRRTLEQLNKEADTALLTNLEYQTDTQFLQDDINGTKEKHKKNLVEIQAYLNILHQINQTVALMPSVSVGTSEEQKMLISQWRRPILSTQLEEYKGTLCRLQAQKQKLQTETSALEQAIRTTQESYDEEIHLYNEQIQSLRKGIGEGERLLEKYTSECRQLATSQTTMENELQRYKRIIENADSRLNSAIIGIPISLFTGNYRSHTRSPTMATGEKDITQAIQDIASEKNQELSSEEVTVDMQEDKDNIVLAEVKAGTRTDVPDGIQISKAFDTLCNIVCNRMKPYRQPEPMTDIYTNGRSVLVTGESSYLDPCFFSTTPSAGCIFVTNCNDAMSPPATINPVSPLSPPDDNHGRRDDMAGGNEDADEPEKSQTPPQPGRAKKNKEKHGNSRVTPDSLSYEKVEVVELVEKLSPDLKVKGYEKTSMVVETIVEKTTKNKHGSQAT